MKKKYIAIFGTIAVIIAAAFVFRFTMGTDTYIPDGQRFKEQYEALNGTLNNTSRALQTLDIPYDNPIRFASADDILELLENGTGVIYFGFPQNPWSRTAVPVLLEAAQLAGVDEILYMNMTYERDLRSMDADGNIIVTREGTPGYQAIQRRLYDYLLPFTVRDAEGNDIDTGERRIYVPLIVVVRNGRVVGHKFYTLPIQDETPFMYFNDEQNRELLEIYLELLSRLRVSDLS